MTSAKKHIRNIIGKLGARNRTEAIVRARALHLLLGLFANRERGYNGRRDS